MIDDSAVRDSAGRSAFFAPPNALCFRACSRCAAIRVWKPSLSTVRPCDAAVSSMKSKGMPKVS